jgi:hypothetical protein
MPPRRAEQLAIIQELAALQAEVGDLFSGLLPE